MTASELQDGGPRRSARLSRLAGQREKSFPITTPAMT
eukprot:CAMPEP_0114169954 /NCGR_PEP_ID=MMETSP0043_2-20121206/33863_1 /TAXON_ID=464988 /ORGANISM="Hemiselmis andersenii, Strain CCMP644" /LENGTH=36 /DNA_ID= /DNA_START= /DNA_END= /DNA_ORIENTATION=